MIRLTLILLLLLCAVWPRPAMAQYGSSDYSLERWDEDYSYLKDVKAASDPFDPIKRIAIGPDDWYLSLGGQARYRFDYFNNTSFGAGAQDEDGFHLARLLGHVDAHFGPNLRAFVQIGTSLEDGRTGGVRPGDMDNFYFQQAFVDFTFPAKDSDSVMIRVGRQELVYGAQRLISPSDWSNVRRSFDGAKLAFSTPTDTLEVFAVRPVIVTDDRLDSSDDHTWFSGIYNVTALPDLFPSAGSKLDLYLLALDRSASSMNAVSSDTFTAGARFHSNPAPWDVDVELDGQFGRYDGSRIAAYSVAAEGGYTFPTLFSPRASLGFDLASGSPNPAHRFNQLFPPLYTYLGHLYLFGRENIIDLHPGLTLYLNRDVTLTLAEHLFWRQNLNDAVYGPKDDEIVREADSSRQSFIGNEFDIALSWQIDRHISAYTGWAHLFTGPFINDTGPHSDEDFFYVMATFTF